MSYIGNKPTQGAITGGNIVDGSIESIDLATLTNIDINSGSIDGTIIGASSAAAGTFTSVDVTGTLSADGLTVDGDTEISGTASRLYFTETDTTDKNTRLVSSGGDFFIQTSSDDKGTNTPRLSIDHATGNVSFYEDTGTTAKMVWDASAESLGIGTTPEDWGSAFPSVLQVKGVSLTTSGGDNGRLFSNTWYDGANYKRIGSGYAHQYEQTGGTHRWYTGATGSADSNVAFSERARIDSSGNLLVGKTSTLIAVDGTYIGANGVVEMVTDGSAPLRLNRKTNDGEIIQLRKDGSTVGSIGTFGSTAVIQSGSAADYCGLLFNNSGGQGYIEPTKATVASGSNPRTDNAVNIGSSTYRFKDLYLSGTIRSVSIYNNTSSGNANLGISAGGEVYRSTSSIKYKEDVQDAQHGLTELLSLRPVTYRGINDGDTVFGGLIAEEVHDAGLTEFVEYNEDNEPDALAYANMVSLCIKAIQDQQEIIESLKTRIETLENTGA